MMNKITEEINKILEDGGYIDGVKIIYSNPQKVKFSFKKLTLKEIAYFEKQLILLSKRNT